MKRVDSVISLIYSLSKSEKKHFSLQVIKDKEEKDYLVIYDIIIKSKQPNGNIVKEEFYRRNPNGSFEVSIQYLYEKLTDTLLTLRKKKDIYYDLLNDLCKARMLYERSLFEECFEMLSNTIKQAQFYENNEILTIALKLELEYLLRLNFPNMTEQELFHKHFIQNETLKKIRKITEQSSFRDHFAQRSLTDCAVHEPQRPRGALLRSGMDRHIDKELGIKLLRVGTPFNPLSILIKSLITRTAVQCQIRLGNSQ